MNGAKIVLGGHLIQFGRYKEEIPMPGQEKQEDPELRLAIKTKCIIYNSEEDKLSEATVSLHHKDNDDRTVGRYYAFRNAMKNLDLSKESKSRIWNDYRKKVKNPTPELELV